MCEAPSCSSPNSGRLGSRAQARGRSIRRKAFRVEATSSSHGDGNSAALAMQVFSGNDVERRRNRSVRRGRKASCGTSRRSQDRRRSRVRSRERRARRAPDGWCRSGVPAGDRGRQRSAEFFVVKALPAATTRGGSAWQTSKDVFPTGARAPKKGAGSVDGRSQGRHGETRHASRTVVPKLAQANTLADPSRPS